MSRKKTPRKFWVILKVRETIEGADGIVGFIPVYKTEKDAKKHAEGKYKIGEITEVAS